MTPDLLALQRRPHRLTITVPHTTFSYLETYSFKEGRSLSNLAAFLLESAIAARSHALTSKLY